MLRGPETVGACCACRVTTDRRCATGDHFNETPYCHNDNFVCSTCVKSCDTEGCYVGLCPDCIQLVPCDICGKEQEEYGHYCACCFDLREDIPPCSECQLCLQIRLRRERALKKDAFAAWSREYVEAAFSVGGTGYKRARSEFQGLAESTGQR